VEHEWELERTLEANAASAPWWDSAPAFVARRFFLFPAAGLVSADPGVPTSGRVAAGEIDVERCALKAIRGEVDDLPSKVRGSVADAGVERVFLTVSR